MDFPLAEPIRPNSTAQYDPLSRPAAAREAGALLLCNTHNPTGRRFTREELLGVAAVADR